MDEPTEVAIAEVCDFASLDPVGDRELVIAALKAKSGSVQDVVLAFYDDPSKFRQSYTWDETSFLGDRDGASDNPNLPTFNIHGPDEGAVIHGVSPSTFHPVAPSRPPSRAQSPLSKMTDWAAQDVAGIGGAPASMAQEDKDLERALAESAAMSGLHTPQESGITTNEGATDLPFFGPAVREAYDPDQWAMVRSAPEAQEPGPSGRRRAPGAPSFLRCRKTDQDQGGSALNAILTILHAIPAARNAFLRTGTPASNYGQNPEWWKGGFIEPIGGVRRDASPRPDDGLFTTIEADSDHAREFIEEVHRVMAFLDNTERAYGTADNFNETFLVKNSTEGDLECAFFHFFRDMGAPEVLDNLFSEVQMVHTRDLDDTIATDRYAILDIRPDDGEHAGRLRDLYGALDAIYWADLPRLPDEAFVDPKMAMISRLGPVQIFRPSVDNLQQPLEVPEFFYADRYMYEHRYLALQMQFRLAGIYRALHEIENARRTIVSYEDVSDYIRRDKTTLSEQALNFAMQKVWQLKAMLFWRRHEESRGTAQEFDFSLADVENTEPETAEELAVLRSIRAEMAAHRQKLFDIKKKLARLNAEREALEKLADRLRRTNTELSTAEDWSPTYRIRLRGVIISPNMFYLCRREEVLTEGEEESIMVDQWWSISYNPYDSEPVSVITTTIESAQQAACRQTSRPTLIYCSDAALNESAEPLSDALRTFVRFDNRYFKQETLEESPREKKRQPAEDATPTSPSKRQQRSNSIDSMASNMASLGEFSDRDMDDVPLIGDRFAVDEGFEDYAEGGVKSEPPTLYDNFRENLAAMTDREPEQEGSLGTEMVQLAISHDGGDDSSRGTEAARDDAGSEGDPGSGGDDARDTGSPGSQKQQQRQQQAKVEKQAPNGAIQLLADWDNPEGRYVGPSDITKDQP